MVDDSSIINDKMVKRCVSVYAVDPARRSCSINIDLIKKSTDSVEFMITRNVVENDYPLKTSHSRLEYVHFKNTDDLEKHLSKMCASDSWCVYASVYQIGDFSKVNKPPMEACAINHAFASYFDEIKH